jgi:hypothetical protein
MPLNARRCEHTAAEREAVWEMDDAVITAVGQVNAEWLNRVLTRSRSLASGQVAGFTVEPRENTCSRSARIRLQYEMGSTGSLPASLFLKICAGGSYDFGPSEVHYYARDYTSLADAPIPRCYDARYSVEPRAYHLLMEDLSDTHRSNFQVSPTEAYGRAVADALAALHAYRWATGPPRGAELDIPGAAEIERRLAAIWPGREPMLECAAGEIDTAWSTALFEIFANHPPRMLERTRRPEGFTGVHGDLNPGNILSPINGDRPVYLIDRQPFDWSLTTWLGVSDLSYMMVHWWETELRRELEIPVLRAYHEGIRRRGVTGYGWEELLVDYRLCAVQSVYVATEWCVKEEDRERMKWVWLPQLRKSMTAYFDLRCTELWR